MAREERIIERIIGNKKTAACSANAALQGFPCIILHSKQTDKWNKKSPELQIINVQCFQEIPH